MHFFLQHHLFKSPLSPINVLRYPTQEMGVENSGDVCEGFYGVGWGLGFWEMVVVTRDIYL